MDNNQLFMVLVSVFCACVSSHVTDRSWSAKAGNSDLEVASHYTYAANCSLDCPTWFVCSAQNNCQCEDGHGLILCDNKRMLSALPTCHCITMDSDSGDIFAGYCAYTCGYKNTFHLPYLLLPKKLNATNFPICAPLHRTGILCGECEKDRTSPVLSYNLTCIKCPNASRNWWKFFVVGFGPLTVFYMFVVLFNINVTSSHMHGVVFFSQLLSWPAYIRVLMLVMESYPTLIAGAKFIIPLYSVWNLDILRSFFPHICLNVNTLQALTLEYLVALYPFFLIFMSYVIIALYDRKITFVVCCWKPFGAVFNKLRRRWDIRTSVIDSFATFFLLSYVKILSVTFDILVFSTVHKFNSKEVSYRLFYDPSVLLFGKEHIIYATIALLMCSLFVLLPTLILICYPFQCFHNFLSCLPFRFYFLHAFVDSFQGCFKDGTEPGVYDYRWFSAVRLLIRMACCVVYATTLGSMYFIYANILLISVSILYIIFQPFKESTVKYPVTDSVFLILLAFTYVTSAAYNVGAMRGYKHLPMAIVSAGFLSGCFPIAYMVFLTLHWFLTKTRIINTLNCNTVN